MQYFFSSIKKGFLKAYHLPLLPDYINNLYNNIFLRIFRVIGGICVVVVLTKKYIILAYPLKWIVLVIAFFQLLLIVVIAIVKLVYGIRRILYHPEDFEVRNSPINRMAGSFASIVEKQVVKKDK